ncbi:hypothetical protein C5167_014865 [Papaver somniferum]|uniref:Uncharacterized protein n=1 Tax=Papaver somniferum TaxID=3469 RepID=A0A4Y7J7W0_PAPSO|nr:hypothetical protein C5167_014865 [Papaver somniferum]
MDQEGVTKLQVVAASGGAEYGCELQVLPMGHQGCVNNLAWYSSRSLLVSGSDDALINIWSYSSWKLLHSIESGHSANIFCAEFVPETCDELVVSRAGDAEVRQFNLSLLTTGKPGDNGIEPSALFQCHSRRVKKLAKYQLFCKLKLGTLMLYGVRVKMELCGSMTSGRVHLVLQMDHLTKNVVVFYISSRF